MTSSPVPYTGGGGQIPGINLPGRVKKGRENRISVVSAVAVAAGPTPVMSIRSLPCVTLECPAVLTRQLPRSAGGCSFPVPDCATCSVRGARHQSGTRSAGRAFAAGASAKPANAVNPNGTFRRAPSPLSGGRQWLP